MSFSDWKNAKYGNTSNKKKKKDEEKYASFSEWKNAKYGVTDDDVAYVESQTDYEDIAPVREENPSWFQKGPFEDGWQFWDPLKAIVGTVHDTNENVTTAIFDATENLIDTAAYGVGAIGSLFDKDFDDEVGNFIAKEILTPKESGEVVATYGNPTGWLNLLVNGGDTEGNSVLGDKSDGLVQSGTHLVGSYALQYLGVPAWLTQGVNAFGSEIESAYQNDATPLEAGISGAISAVAEVAFEKLSSGIKFKSLGGTFDEGVKQFITDKISNKIGRTVAKYVSDAAGESIEEGLTEIVSALGKKFTYMDDKEFNEIMSSEDLFDALIGGAIMGGVAGGGRVIKSAKTGRDYTTGLTDSEERVVNKYYEDAVAERKNSGTKLNYGEKAKIYDGIIEQMATGQLDIDTIEEVLGGKTYEEYKSATDKENALKTELKELSNMKSGDMTRVQQKRLAELEAMNLDDTTKRDELRKALDDKLAPMIENSKLAESYNEKARKGQAFEADLTKYTGKQKEAVQRAVDSGVLNNSFKSHQLVDTLSKIEADKGITIDYADNEKLKELGYYIGGKTVNGVKTGNGFILNVQGAKAWQSTVGHEIAHILEGTGEAYNNLRSELFAFAESKGELESRRASLTELYKGMGADIDAELTADLLGDYLFTDKNFINKLSSNRNLFQKIYDEIKYLWNVATGKQKAEIEKVKKAFDEAWKELNTNKKESKVTDAKGVGDVALSLSGVNKYGIEVYETSKETMDLTWDERKAKYLEALKNEYRGRTARFERNGHIYYAEFDRKHISKHIYGDDRSSPKGKKALIKAGADGDVFDLVENSQYDRSSKNKKNHTNADYFDYFVKTVQIDGKVFDLIADVEKNYGVDGGYVYTLALRDNKKIKASPAIETSKEVSTENAGNTFSEQILPQNSNDVNTKFSLSAETDAEYMSAIERGDTETAQRIVEETADKYGYSIRAYHGTARGDRVGSVFLPERATSGPMAFFTDDKQIAENYSKSKQDTSIAYDPDYDRYETQFRIKTKDQKHDLALYSAWAFLPTDAKKRITEKAGQLREDWDGDYDLILDPETNEANGGFQWQLTEARGNAIKALTEQWLNSGTLFNDESRFLDVLEMAGVTEEFKKIGMDNLYFKDPNAKHEKVYDTFLKITNPFDTANTTEEFASELENWYEEQDQSKYEGKVAYSDVWDKNNITAYDFANRLRSDIENNTTHAWTSIPDSVTDFLKSKGYDGIKDTGGKYSDESHTVYIPFSSEQIKSADPVTYDDNGNVISLSERFNPDNVDIRYSISNEGEEFAPIGNFSTPLKDLAIVKEDTAPMNAATEDIAPAQGKNVPANDVVEDVAPMPINSNATPTSKKLADGTRSEELLVDSLDNYPMETIEQKVAEKIRAVEGNLADNRNLRRESIDNYNEQIAEAQEKYNAKKNKKTKAATELLQRISLLERMKANADAEFSKRISDLEARVQKMKDPKYSRAMYKKAKMQEHADWAENLLGDTSTWKDKKIGLQYATNTERRNLRDIVRDENGNQDIARADAIDDALNGRYNREEAAKKRELAQIRKKYADLKITNAENTYIQMLGELRHNPDTTLTEKVVSEYYEKHKEKIDTAKVDKVIELARQDYDNFIKRVNEKLREQGMKEIPYRQGYFLHYTDPKQNFIQKLFNWKTQDNEIPTSIAGLSETFKPVKSWQAFDKTRHSDKTDYNFSKGFDTYSEGVLDWIYHLDTLQKRRAVENHIRFTHSEEGIKARIKEVYANEELDANEAQAQIEHILSEAKNPLNNFVQDFTTHTNILAGKKNSLDRAVEQGTNRHIYSVMTNVQNRMSANMVLANVRSAMTNFIPITQSWAQVSPLRSLQATKDTIANAIKDDGVINKSTFLTNRLKTPDNLYNTTWDMVLDKAGIMFEVVDGFASQVIWRSKYNQNLADGMTEAQAIKNADQFAENVMAGRSKGNEPTLFNAKNPLVKAFTMFQLEVNNQYGYLFKDVPNDLKAETEHWKLNLAKGYTMAFIGAYVYNEIFEKLAGSGAALDPIGIIEDLLRDLGLFDDDEEKEPMEALGNFAENVVQEVPFVGGLAGGGRIPLSSAIPYDSPIKMVTGTAQDFADKDWKNLLDEWSNPVYNLVLPVGGGQIKKTVQGLGMFSDEHPVSGSYTNSGNLRFPVEDTIGNRIQAGIFGQYASENAREYFDNGYAPLKKKQIQEYIDVDMPIKDYWEYREGLAKQDTLEEKFDYIAGLDLPVYKKNILINNVVDREEEVDLEGYDDFANYEEFDYAVKNPEKYAFSKAVGGYSSYKTYSSDLNDIKADKDAYGKSISGSRKQKVLDYINNLDADYYTKIILYKSEYPSDDTYNMEIIDYLNSREDITYDDMVSILTYLDFTVDAEGNIYWN